MNNTAKSSLLTALGVELVPVRADSFRMGGGGYEYHADSMPEHLVHLTKAFAISEAPVSYDAFIRFYSEVNGRGSDADIENYRGYAVGVSYYEAAAFCEWLSEKEGALYRLPTEAEWEYAARNARRLGLDRMCDAVLREWCSDWYEDYRDEEETNPAGPDSGLFKVVRGGYLDQPERYNQFPLDVWLRCSLPPSYRHYRGDTASFGRHSVGFRVVRGDMPATNGRHPFSFFNAGVHQNTAAYVKAGPSAGKPYFRKRYLFPVPPDNASPGEISALGWNPSFRHHHHSPGFTEAPNGDLLFSVYSSYHEYDPGVGLVAARLRKGCDEWEMPDMFLNPVGVNDHAPLLFTDSDGTVYQFWGWPQLKDSFPFQYSYSKDSGATWSDIQFPRVTGEAAEFARQPINTLLHAKDGSYYLPCDGDSSGIHNVANSVLWRSRDGMKTWEMARGRTPGRHSTVVELSDGGILSMGGKNSEIDGYMPKAVSRDGGDSWEVTKTPFPALNSGQRPCIMRLKSGDLFFCGDYQALKVFTQPEGIGRKGCYAAWSSDEGATWSVKKLWGTQPHKRRPLQPDDHILGYCVCRQSQDGMIHIAISNTRPLLHFEFNELWLKSYDENAFPPDAPLMASSATELTGKPAVYEDYYENGALRCRWSGGIADDGRFLLHGKEICYYPNGAVMAEAEFQLGKRIGISTFLDPDGHTRWQWDYRPGGEAVFTTYHDGPEPVTAHQGHYKDRMAHGTARTYDKNGVLTREAVFEKGLLVSDKSF